MSENEIKIGALYHLLGRFNPSSLTGNIIKISGFNKKDPQQVYGKIWFADGTIRESIDPANLTKWQQAQNRPVHISEVGPQLTRTEIRRYRSLMLQRVEDFWRTSIRKTKS